LLLARHADARHRNENLQTPLHYAAGKNHTGVVRLLLQHGADRAAKDRTGATPLHRAAAHGFAGAVRLLLGDGAEVAGASSPLLLLSIADAAGNTAAHVAAEAGLVEVVAQMLDRCPDAQHARALLAEQRNAAGRSVLDLVGSGDSATPVQRRAQLRGYLEDKMREMD
jgi:ankyrin repeat protein